MYSEKKESIDCQYLWDLTSPNNIGHQIPRFKFLFEKENEINWIIQTHKKTPMNFMKLWKDVIYQAYQTYVDTERQDQLYWAIIDRLNHLPDVKSQHEEKYQRYAYSMIIKGNHYSDEVFSDMKKRFKEDWLNGAFCNYYRSSKVKEEDIKELLESSKNTHSIKFSFRSLLYNPNYISEEDLKYILDYCQYQTNNKIDLNLIIQCPNVNFNIIKMYLDVSSELNLLISVSSWKRLAKLTKKMSETQILYLLNQAPQLANHGVTNNPINLSIELLE